jgi:RNA polymerase sigma-70 factor (ECF subfamily)
LFGIAVRIALANRRKRVRELALGFVEMSDDGPDPEDVLQTKQTQALLEAALGRIPLPRRTVLMLHELEDVPVTEVAALLSIPLFTVYSRLRKARKELRVATLRILNEAEGRREARALIPAPYRPVVGTAPARVEAERRKARMPSASRSQ